MNDRELLERAARAAGYTVAYDKIDRRFRIRMFEGQHEDTWARWNPLTDDGDALRLAVALNLHAMRSSANRIVCYKEKAPFDGDLPGNGVWREISDCWFPSAPVESAAVATDQLSATRRAIVRAAAEMCP